MNNDEMKALTTRVIQCYHNTFMLTTVNLATIISGFEYNDLPRVNTVIAQINKLLWTMNNHSADYVFDYHDLLLINNTVSTIIEELHELLECNRLVTDTSVLAIQSEQVELSHRKQLN